MSEARTLEQDRLREVDQLTEVDQLELTERVARLRDSMLSAPRRISVERMKLAMESWKETDGEDIEIRRAKLFKQVVEGVPIAIHDFDLIVGRETEHLVGTPVFMDETGDSVPGLWDETPTTSAGCSSAEPCRPRTRRSCANAPASSTGKTAPDHVKAAWRALVGTWAEDLTEAKVHRPHSGFRLLPGHHLPGHVGEDLLAGHARPRSRKPRPGSSASGA